MDFETPPFSTHKPPQPPCHCEARRAAPQGGLSCPFGAIHLLAISCRLVAVSIENLCHCEPVTVLPTKSPTTSVIASQCAHWRGNPYSFWNSSVDEIRLGETDCHGGQSPPRNDRVVDGVRQEKSWVLRFSNEKAIRFALSIGAVRSPR